MNLTEKNVLAEMRQCLSDKWTILHGIWIRRHKTKNHAEADFIIIADRGVLILEVKGAQVKRGGDGRWKFGSAARGYHEDESPFEQAKSAYYAIREHFRRNNLEQLFHDRICGWGVVLPDCILDIDGSDPLIDPCLYLDKTKYPEGFLSWIESLFEYWKKDNLRLKENLNIPAGYLRTHLTADDQNQIRRLIQPMIRPIGGDLSVRNAEQKIVSLTREQKKALRYHDTSKIMIQGPPGTGKTILCREIAHREALADRMVLYICFNRLLALHVQREFEHKYPALDITVLNYHQLIMKLCQEAGTPIGEIVDWKYFNEKVEGLVLDSITKLEDEGAPYRKYDYLVMDESQDLMTLPFKSSLDLIFEGGWENGKWAIAGDPDQAIFHEQFDRSIYDDLMNTSGVSFCPLTLNCRNTEDIAISSHGLSGIGKPEIREREDEPLDSVRFEFYKDRKDLTKLIKKQVNDLIGKLKNLADESRTIAILAADTDYLLPELSVKGFFIGPVVAMEKPHPWQIKAGTLQSFKGLEASAVVLLGLENLDQMRDRELMYVGGTRAILFLRILVNEKNKQAIMDRQGDIIKLLK